MSGMKFRLQCATCNTVFFSPDRKARDCPKCLKKRSMKSSAPPARARVAAGATINRGPAKPLPGGMAKGKPAPVRINRQPKSTELTPELRAQIDRMYQEQFAGKGIEWRGMVAQISDKLWVNRKCVSAALREIIYPKVPASPAVRAQVIELYDGFVERGERPAEGRRRKISELLGLSYHQVKNIVYEWSQSQYDRSPTPDLSREQRFAIEKLYWNELAKKQSRLSEFPAKIAEQLEYLTAYQVSRWLDKLHDDDHKFEQVDDVPAEIEQRILNAYREYLAASQPPEQGLHSTIAQLIGGVTNRQVHKVLQRFRKQRRAEYPLQ